MAHAYEHDIRALRLSPRLVPRARTYSASRTKPRPANLCVQRRRTQQLQSQPQRLLLVSRDRRPHDVLFDSTQGLRHVRTEEELGQSLRTGSVWAKVHAPGKAAHDGVKLTLQVWASTRRFLEVLDHCRHQVAYPHDELRMQRFDRPAARQARHQRLRICARGAQELTTRVHNLWWWPTLEELLLGSLNRPQLPPPIARQLLEKHDDQCANARVVHPLDDVRVQVLVAALELRRVSAISARDTCITSPTKPGLAKPRPRLARCVSSSPIVWSNAGTRRPHGPRTSGEFSRLTPKVPSAGGGLGVADCSIQWTRRKTGL